ncbi:MAG TPA: methyltransferase domain-containing protein [Longimicrobiales bacterium]|nr:methyltransferase domain-containing protein [Longimicrobiales bacterium]
MNSEAARQRIDGNSDQDGGQQGVVRHYDASYSNFASALYQDIRREAFGEDIGQNSWLSAGEYDAFLDWLGVSPGMRVLDVGCGSGGPALRLARRAGCEVLGIDIHEQAVRYATLLATRQGLGRVARFQVVDAGGPLPFAAGSFDAVVCIDSINHFPDRGAVFREWTRVLKPRGRALFTDPVVVTGPLSKAEIAARSSTGFFLYVPPGCDERLAAGAGLAVVRAEDVTDNMAEIATRWRAARQRRAPLLGQVEGVPTFEAQQEFFRIAEITARERRLSRFAYLAARRA